MPQELPPETAAFMEAFWAAAIFGIVLGAWFLLGHRSEDYGPTNWQRFRIYFFVTSSEDDEEETEQEPHTSTTVPPSNVVLADTVAAEREQTEGTSIPAPRTNKRLADAEIIALLSTLKGDNGKHRFSANEIATLVKGTRMDVLDQVRAIRNLPQYPPVTPEQQALRNDLEAA